MLSKLAGWAALAFVLLLSAACEDPTNVGEDLVGGLEGEPFNAVVYADSLKQAESTRDVTSGQNRVLAGTVVDPALGTIDATGLIDFAAASSVPANFRDSSVTRVELRMYRNYTYGDTTAALTLRLYELPAELSFTRIHADTTISFPANPITEFTVRHSDTLVVVPLPADWVQANSDTLKSAQFASNFHGFAIDADMPQVAYGAVTGLSATAPRSTTTPGIILRVVTGTSRVVDYSVSGRASTVSRLTPPDLPADRVLLQDGLQPAVHAVFDYSDQDSLKAAAVNRAVLVLPNDDLAQQTPMHFLRPAARLFLAGEYGTLTNPTIIPFRYLNGRYLSGSPTRVDPLSDFIQQDLLGVTAPDRYRIEAYPSDNTINAAVFYAPTESVPASEQPQVRLTVTPAL